MISLSDRSVTVQLRRYRGRGGLARLVEWFPTIAQVRDQYGFTIEAAYAIKKTVNLCGSSATRELRRFRIRGSDIQRISRTGGGIRKL